MGKEVKRRIVFDCKLIRPGCVILQAGMGGDPALAHVFPVETWLVHPTPDMKVYELDDIQLQKLIEMVSQNQKNRGDKNNEQIGSSIPDRF